MVLLVVVEEVCVATYVCARREDGSSTSYDARRRAVVFREKRATVQAARDQRRAFIV